MKFTTITTAQLIHKLSSFIQAAPEKKVAYARDRARLLGWNVGGMTNDELLEVLKTNERLMQRFVDQYEEKKSVVTPGLVLSKQLLSLTGNFIQCAVPAAIKDILSALEGSKRAIVGQRLRDMNEAIDSLFNDREHLKLKLQAILTMINDPAQLSEILFTDRATFDNVYLPITSPEDRGENYGIAFDEFMGVELCMLINYSCVEVNNLYRSKVQGFSHEFYLYVVLHELTHLMIRSDDNSYAYASDDEIENYDVYSTVNLKPDEINNADNYCTLIFIALAKMHSRGRINLKCF